MICLGCGNQEAYRIRGGKYKDEYGKTVDYEVCDKCGSLKAEKRYEDVSRVDAPYFDEHLCDKEHPKGQWISSRHQKAAVLNKLGLREKSESKIPYIKDINKRREYFRSHFG